LGAQVIDHEEASDDSASTDEGAVQIQDYNQRMMQLFKMKEGQAKHFELDSKVGLNGQQTCWSFPCMLDASRGTFFVWLGDITIDCFTKTTFLSLTNFAEEKGATKVILVQFRDHVQKVQFQRLFKVLDAERCSKRSMQELMGSDKLEENVETYALYRIALD